MVLSAKFRNAFAQGGTPTISGTLVGLGMSKTWMCGPKRIVGEGVTIGPAFTISFLPARDDVTTKSSYAAEDSIMTAVEAVPEGAVVVIDARGEKISGTVGDILVDRLRVRGAAGLITDGAVRDVVGLRRVGLPVWAAAHGAPEAIVGLHYAGHGAPIGCGGVLVMPGDLIVADDDGPVLVPASLVDSVGEKVVSKVEYEVFVMEKVSKGRPLTGLYPANEETEREYAAWAAARR